MNPTLYRFLAWFSGFKTPAPPKEPPCTLAQAAQIMSDCWADDAHEDALFYAYCDKCRADGIEFTHTGFCLYAGEHWNRPRDAYGYRGAFLASEPHHSGVLLDGLRAKAREA